MTFGAPHRHFRVTDSTNARARELVEAGAPGGTVVTAAEQTAGRGRQGRSWTAPPGKALLYSAVLRPLDQRHLLLPLSAPLAVCEAAEELEPGLECRIKWPNDVWVERRKLAGVLIEAKPQDGWAVIGVGLNLSIAPGEFPSDLRETATSIFCSSAGGRGKSRRSLPAVAPAGLPPTPATAAAVLSRHLARWVEADRDAILGAWRDRDALYGREVSWNGGAGVADGIEDSGDLVVVAAGGDRVVLGAGEVHLRL
ncbi:MAG TPA: biotin--[acetyl-CoA-carboxylase] ligase [Solirubrobacterales bacterium]|nr:biotin--[acetyl-CoA-carboxylase] ligase [Solirubrobacterales bacterium]